ncbi:hypothetical protein DFP72DRAFT_1078063 [Ephemerocybe angulata]|uniref:Uncharacterized protein n=1 Tax=Ephemerocybe angulata TaxID=980116 RepID=A0A8H6HEL3_9AGAR|nr:hypothetical protein DFP72DRAFT_1078063 [Tulosesus angulatus]
MPGVVQTSLPLTPSSLKNMVSPYSGPSSLYDGQFAFARVKGEVCLVQVSCSSPSSPFLPIDVNVFKHEFITIFRFSESTTLHPADFQVIEAIDDSLLRYEEENQTVFLAKSLMEHLRRFSADPRKARLQQQQRLLASRPSYPSQRYRQR